MFTSLGELCHQVVVTAHCKEQQEMMNRSIYGKEVADTLGKNFYVDDLKSVQHEQTAIKLMKDVTAICAVGKFRLTKCESSCKDVAVSIPEGKRWKGLEDQKLSLGTLSTESTCGIHWNVEKDELGFDVNFKDKPHKNVKCFH